MQGEANRGAAMDVGGWLRGLGLEQYEAAFRENEISEKVLPNLTAEDLKDLGVGIVGNPGCSWSHCCAVRRCERR